ncbi:MAG: carbohydrate ABC transporter permease [Anaerolineae bacterium]
MEQVSALTRGAHPAVIKRRSHLAIFRHKVLPKVITYLILLLGSVGFLLPFIWMLSSSLKTPGEIFIFPPKWLPSSLQWGNYPRSLTEQPFGRYTINTLTITSLTLLGTLVSCSLVAFGFARIRGAGSNFLFGLVLATMMLPSQVTMIPTFILFRILGWVDTLKPLIVPSFFGSAFFIFLLRQFMMTVPLEMDEAATIDGCSPFGVYWRIMLPMSKPALATVAIFSFMDHWTDLMGPLIYLNSRNNYTIAIGLATYRQKYATETPWNLLMAASIVTMMPTLILFFLSQRIFIQGIVVTGLKG